MPTARAIAAACAALAIAPSSLALRIGVDNVHGFDDDALLGSGSDFDTFRAIIEFLGHEVVPMASFEMADLASIDALFLRNAYSQNDAEYTPSEMQAIEEFAQGQAAFLSDASIWTDVGVGRDTSIIGFDHQSLLENIVNYFTSVEGGVTFIADAGAGYDIANFNQLVDPFGVTYANVPVNPNGLIVGGFFVSEITVPDVRLVEVDFHLPMTFDDELTDLTQFGDDNNVLGFVPGPSSVALLAPCAWLVRRRR